jgi:hypothetical protein
MSLDRLRRAAESLAGTDEGDYLLGAVRRLAAGLDADQALELTGPGALRERDRLLVQAGILAAPRATAWGQAGALEALIQSRDRRNSARPLSDAEVLLDAAARCCRLPTTRRHLYAILAAELERTEKPIENLSTDAA